MIPDDIKISIANWAKQRDRENADTLVLLILAYIEDNNIDWSSSLGRRNAISYINAIYYGESNNHISIKDNWIGHQPNTNSFEQSSEDVFPQDHDNVNDSISTVKSRKVATNKHKNIEEPELTITKYIDQIETQPFPYEIKEIMRELEDNAYKSCILTNLDSLGRIRLIRKAQILIKISEKQNKS